MTDRTRGWTLSRREFAQAGAERTPVTGIATTVMSTFDVIKRAAAARRNMIITHEPTFCSPASDQPLGPQNRSGRLRRISRDDAEGLRDDIRVTVAYAPPECASAVALSPSVIRARQSL